MNATESGLPRWVEPADFMRLGADSDGLDPVHLNCLNHCLRDVLLGHGVESPLKLLARPLGLTLVVDKTLRIWLISRAEEEWDDLRYNAGLSARWIPIRTEAGFLGSLAGILDSGRLGIARATRWRVPWQTQSPLAPADWHATLFAALDGDRVRVVDRQYAGSSTAARDMWVDVGQLRSTIAGGVGLLDYRMTDARQAAGDEVEVLLGESARSLECGPPFPAAGKAYGRDALDQLETLLTGASFAALDSDHLRFMLRWHLPSCIRKFVIGNRKVLGLYIEKNAIGPDRYKPVLACLESGCSAWDEFAKTMALAARRTGREPGPELAESLARVRGQEDALTRELHLAAGHPAG
jgi:hypothetical protein